MRGEYCSYVLNSLTPIARWMGSGVPSLWDFARTWPPPHGRPLHQRALHVHEGSGDLFVLRSPKRYLMECRIS